MFPKGLEGGCFASRKLVGASMIPSSYGNAHLWERPGVGTGAFLRRHASLSVRLGRGLCAARSGGS